jgi:protein-disulfide isomerase
MLQGFFYTPKFGYISLMNFRRFLVGTLLIALPLVVVRAVKQTSWGPILAAPKARETGNPNAKVTIVEYSDFQCPSCAMVDPTVHKFLEIYQGKVRLIYKYYPLTHIHKNSMPAAHAAECAAGQNKFWPYHDRLFQTQLAWAPLADPTTSYMAIAQDVHLDLSKFQACYADPAPIARINADAQEAQARDVTATPTFFVGEDRLVGQVFVTDGARAIEKAMRQ